MLSLDCETTGLDLYHGAKPFFVTTCAEDGTQRFWEWDVDPLTREPNIPEEDAREIRQLLAAQHDGIVLQNAKFDATALLESGISDWTPLWELTHDTLLAAHLLGSNRPKDLTSLVSQYLGRDLQPFEDATERCVKECRRLVQQAKLRGKRGTKAKEDERLDQLADWAIAEAGRADMPSATDETWKHDLWLPRAVAGFLGYDEGHEYWTVTRDYANSDSAATLALWGVMERRLKDRGLWKLYEERRKLPSVVHAMERRGVTLSKARLDDLTERYAAGAEASGRVCVNIARGLGHELDLPRGGRNRSLEAFLTDGLRLPVVALTDKGNPSLDKAVMAHHLATLLANSKQLTFVRHLLAKRSQDTAVSYMDGYRRFWLPVREGVMCSEVRGLRDVARPISGLPAEDCVDGGGGEWFRLHPSVNVTGTDTLRSSSRHPNEQNISKKEDFNLRYAFGPAPGREWWSLDYENIELRIPAYEAGEPAMVELFERPDDPPYFGSYHLLNASIVYPDLFWPVAEKEGEFKRLYKATWYQWCKNGGFAIQYGCQEAKADATFRRRGAYRAIKEKMPRVAALHTKYISQAERLGYVETLPDRTVDPNHGYPLLCTRSTWGKVTPTVPLNYHVQGTACWCKNKALVRCHEQLERWYSEGFDGHIIMDVHDEIVFDLPAGGRANLPRVNRLRQLMEQSGADVGIPLKVGVAYHPSNWAEEEEPGAETKKARGNPGLGTVTR